MTKSLHRRKMENILAEEIKRKFEQVQNPKYDRIFVSKKPFLSKTLKEKWFEAYANASVNPELIPPLQPEIDMIFCKDKTMMAVELKYFKRKGKGLDHSFYEGIEQALALLRWGFDYVALWQLFEYPSITESELWFYGGWTWRFLHAPTNYGGLELPVEFTYMLVKKENEGYDFPIVQPITHKDGSLNRLTILPPPYAPNFSISTPHSNTLLKSSAVQEMRAMLTKWLNTQEP